MSDLQRITSETIEHEDRIRLTGAVEAGDLATVDARV